MKPFLIAALIAVASAGPGIAQPKRDWTTAVSAAPSGSYVYGNPAAKAKLVEYLSYTCSHCAHFSVEASATIKRDYVAKGTTSIEMRHALRDPLDFAAALLARCDGPARFRGHSEAIFAAQENWLGKAAGFQQANAERLKKLPMSQALAEYANGVGLSALMKARGLTQPKINACLASPAQQKLLAAMADEAWGRRKINGTPSFLLNGAAVQGSDWATLKPKLDAAIR